MPNLDFFENKYFFAVFSILMFMYAAQIRPNLPKFIMDLFQNPIFRVAILFLILVRGYKDPQFALIVAVAFLLIMNVVNEQLFKETFADAQLPVNMPAVVAQEVINNATQNQQEMDCIVLNRKMNDLNECLKQTVVLDCTSKSGKDKEACEKTNVEIVETRAALGRNKYKTSELFNNKCNNVIVNYDRKPTTNLICKDLN